MRAQHYPRLAELIAALAHAFKDLDAAAQHAQLSRKELEALSLASWKVDDAMQALDDAFPEASQRAETLYLDEADEADALDSLADAAADALALVLVSAIFAQPWC